MKNDFARMRYPPIPAHARAITAQGVTAAEHVPGKMFAKRVMILPADGQQMVMLVLAALYHVNPQKAAAALDAREVLLAEEQRFADAFSDYEVGAIPSDAALRKPLWCPPIRGQDVSGGCDHSLSSGCPH